MFSFSLPVGATLSVALPTGGGAAITHAGDGRFLSALPPIMFQGLLPADADVSGDALAVTWDAKFFVPGEPVKVVDFGYDVVMAAAAVSAAADGGDAYARQVVENMEAAQRMIEARLAVQRAAARTADPEAVVDSQDAA